MAAGAAGQANRPASGGETVSWATPDASVARVRPGGLVALVVRGTIREGWHVYGLKQPTGGPTPLRVAVEPGDLAKPHGTPSGSIPVTVFEPAFGLRTPYYVGSVTLNVPVRLGAGAPAGRQLIPVSVRFQTCNGQTCEPPKTVHLFAPVNVVTSL